MSQNEVKKRKIEFWSDMLSLIVLLILGRNLGNNGLAYVAAALEMFLFVWILTGSRAASSLGKILRLKNSRGHYKNAERLKSNAMLLESILGLVGMLVLIGCAHPAMNYLFHSSYSVPVLILLAPALLLRMISAVFLGCFQGEGNEFPTLIVGILRPLLVLGLSLLCGGILGNYGKKVANLLWQTNFEAMYRGMGIAIAITVTELLALLVLIILQRKNGRKARRDSDGVRATESLRTQAHLLYGTQFQSVLGKLFLFLPLWLGMMFFCKGTDNEIAMTNYGLYFGKYLLLCGCLVLPGCAGLLANCAKVSSYLRKEERRPAKNFFGGGLHIGVINALYLTMLVAVLAPQIAGLLCESGTEIVIPMLRVGAIVILFMILGFYFTVLLNVTGDYYLMLIAAAVYDIVFLVSLLVMLRNSELGVMALLYAGLFAGAVLTLGAGGLFCYRNSMEIDWVQYVAIPAGAVCVTGLISLFLNNTLFPHLGHLVTVIVVTVLGTIVYWFLLLLLRNFRIQELNYVPGGKLIQKMGQTMQIF